MKKTYLGLILIGIFILSRPCSAQNYEQTLGQELNAITTSVPFLMIAPDSRSGALGDAGVALSPDGYSQYWNSSKLAFIDKPMGITISYTPWLKKLVNDINLAYLAGYYKIDENQTIGASLRYFSMGEINFTDNDGEPLTDFSPHEYAVDVSYNRKLSDNFSLGMAGRFILSNLTGGQTSSGEEVNTGKSVAMDINGYYKDALKISDYNTNWSLGFNLSNIGTKLGYTEGSKNFIPTNLRLGGAITIDIDDYNSITGTIDVNKMLIPTPPVYYSDSLDKDGNKIIYKGKDPDVSVTQGMIQSFHDAPGGFKEEMHEFSYGTGIEYWYAKQFAVRVGYFAEHATKGNRKYFTAGVGLKMNVFGLDFSYLIPSGNFNNSPLSNTWRFSLIFDLDSFNNQ